MVITKYYCYKTLQTFFNKICVSTAILKITFILYYKKLRGSLKIWKIKCVVIPLGNLNG